MKASERHLKSPPETSREAFGLWLGYLVGPFFALGSLTRRARVFHPHGMVFLANVKPVFEVTSQFSDLAKSLSGNALVRLSSSVWKQEVRRPDLLGCAIRFRAGKPPSLCLSEGEQDVLMITSRSLLTFGLAFLKTNPHDFLDNLYHGMAPYTVVGHRDMRLRLTPLPCKATGKSREQKIRDATDNGEAVFRFEVAHAESLREWMPVVEIKLTRLLEIPDMAIEFSPFFAELGIRP